MLQFQNSISVADILNFVLLLATSIGVFFAYRQIKEARKTQKASFFKDLYSTMFTDTEIGKAYYKIEYEKFVYDEHFHGSEEERAIDNLLGFLDLLCDLYNQRVISDHEMRAFKYHLLRVYENPNVQKYLDFLTLYYRRVGSGTRPFNSFLGYCESEPK